MNILKDLLSEVPQQALELSQHLYDELQALRNESAISAYHSEIQKLNEMIWEYHESNRRALVVEDKQEAVILSFKQGAGHMKKLAEQLHPKFKD